MSTTTATDWRAALVNIDGSPEGAHMAQWDDRVRWNGWLCPAFDALTVEAILAVAETEPDYMSHEWVGGNLVLTEIMYRDEDANYEPEVIAPDADGLYSLGAFGWCWAEVI